MKIVKTCDDGKTKTVVKLADIPNGTVFRYGAHTSGPYYRIKSSQVDGIVDLASNLSWSSGAFTDYNFNNEGMGYLPLPNAKLVTGE